MSQVLGYLMLAGAVSLLVVAIACEIRLGLIVPERRPR